MRVLNIVLFCLLVAQSSWDRDPVEHSGVSFNSWIDPATLSWHDYQFESMHILARFVSVLNRHEHQQCHEISKLRSCTEDARHDGKCGGVSDLDQRAD